MSSVEFKQSSPVVPEGDGEREQTAFISFSEKLLPDLTIACELNQLMFKDKSQFQDVWCIKTSPFGKVLVLDGKTQSAQCDEKIYHECLVHPPLLMCENPRTVFIGGGGETATAREILKHKSVEKVVMVDLDKMVVDACREHLPEWAAGAFDDPRLEIYYQDAKAWLENFDGKFDVIIMDIADPIEAGPGIALYYQEFYEFVGSKLNPGGVFVTQSSGSGLFSMHECFTVINNTMKSGFDFVFPYSAEIPSFGGAWGFNLAFNKTENRSVDADIVNWTPEFVDEQIAKRIDTSKGELFFYDGIAHRHIFNVPKYLRTLLKKETRVMTSENPVFMY
eukprot:TRINITY_DN80509_c0_g1_i1.p1 TRINITY_DN80509_c0_g1~~TRINITY_DN80509_c0_g1_i1.p1  ORF type:complete len:335 (-),score=111.82 TRINITY_DN80509_c0_g1_i1:97-1101(-)